MTRQNVPDRAALLQRGVQRIDRGTGNAEGDSPCRASLCLLDTMIAGTTGDLNEAEFVSRDVE
jgi:hypothetical protein